jgi:hypothetical protein
MKKIDFFQIHKKQIDFFDPEKQGFSKVSKTKFLIK